MNCRKFHLTKIDLFKTDMFFAPPKEIIPDLQRQNNFSPYGNDHVYCDFKYHGIQLYVTWMVYIFYDKLTPNLLKWTIHEIRFTLIMYTNKITKSSTSSTFMCKCKHLGRNEASIFCAFLRYASRYCTIPRKLETIYTSHKIFMVRQTIYCLFCFRSINSSRYVTDQVPITFVKSQVNFTPIACLWVLSF